MCGQMIPKGESLCLYADIICLVVSAGICMFLLVLEVLLVYIDLCCFMLVDIFCFNVDLFGFKVIVGVPKSFQDQCFITYVSVRTSASHVDFG